MVSVIPVGNPGPAAPPAASRTHEENKERAYIAASRRTDRSLKARMESAKKASDIHRARTGRGLRFTEQDVLNQQLYLEEDLVPAGHGYDELSRVLQAELTSAKELFDYMNLSHAGVRNCSVPPPRNDSYCSHVAPSDLQIEQHTQVQQGGQLHSGQPGSGLDPHWAALMGETEQRQRGKESSTQQRGESSTPPAQPGQWRPT